MEDDRTDLCADLDLVPCELGQLGDAARGGLERVVGSLHAGDDGEVGGGVPVAVRHDAHLVLGGRYDVELQTKVMRRFPKI